ncbi:hypothetical protein K469DRAFT_41183 [Zopfia rhizophila CBS 207.26]|uniref:Uncharacterized protein n=1 Tax=Zopfia rhizophila CBS 207.26 TaxID=1314779 RepID=A0A6A6EHZ0_9PEZI|nr:hypothetical protein K469DRAFT_41183 [Zopfia rhizophila CBS 207.26]
MHASSRTGIRAWHDKGTTRHLTTSSLQLCNSLGALCASMISFLSLILLLGFPASPLHSFNMSYLVLDSLQNFASLSFEYLPV